MVEPIYLPPTASWTILAPASHSRSAGEEFPALFCVTYIVRSFAQPSLVFVRRCKIRRDVKTYDFSSANGPLAPDKAAAWHVREQSYITVPKPLATRGNMILSGLSLCSAT